MLNMQAFHKWLTSTDVTPDTLQGRMARLARIGRARIMKITGELVWFIWDAPDVTSA